MYKELEEAVHECGAILLYLPPYSPQLNPIEALFGQLKRWIQRYANLAFPILPDMVLDIAMVECVKENSDCTGLLHHCGYDQAGLNSTAFDLLLDNNE